MPSGTITLEGALVSTAVGVIDVGTREVDFQQGWNSKQLSATNVFRGITFFGSLMTNIVTKNKAGWMGVLTEVAFYSSTPLIVDTFYVLAKNALQGTTISSQPNFQAPAAPPTPSPSTGAGGGGQSKTY